MAYIYQITNSENEMKYIGQTNLELSERLRLHIQDSLKPRKRNRSLYAAMNELGHDKFQISLIEECDNSDDREMYWIERLGTYNNGYNDTMGGKGKRSIDHNLVLSEYQTCQNASAVARKIGICSDSVCDILHKHNIQVVPSSIVSSTASKRSVLQIDPKTGEIVATYLSILDAENAMKGKTNRHICAACNGKRKTCAGYIWRYA